MKYPVIYIKHRGSYMARFAEMFDEPMIIATDITTAMRSLVPIKTKHAFILYEQREPKTDCRNIRFLHSWFPEAGILLITDKQPSAEDSRGYLRAGVNSAIPNNASSETLHQTLQFIDSYTFQNTNKSSKAEKVVLFRMPIWKRTFDILASLTAILLLSPLLITAAIAIRIDGSGPIIYRSKRVGSNYRVFDFLKFRSMRIDADKQLKALSELNQYSDPTAVASSESSDSVESNDFGPMLISDDNVDELLAGMDVDVLISDEFIIPEADHLRQVEAEQDNAFTKLANDPRITPLGRILRKYSIDELPQLFNILKGDMSVVGNRPLPLYEAEVLTSDEYVERFMCPSGLTGLWQVEKRGHAGKLSPEQRKQLDIEYAHRMSIWLDISIIFRTFTAFIQKENV